MSSGLIFDIGMNNGDDTAYYLCRGNRVVAVEANPELVRDAERRFREEIADGRLVIINAGIADREGELPFWLCDLHSEWSSFHRSIASRENSGHREIMVRCIRFRSVIEKYGVPDYLKIDIEGYDAYCLKDLTPETAPEYISVEASDIELLDLLQALGYKRFKCISQFHFLPLEIPASVEQLRYEENVRANKGLDEFRTFNGWHFSVGASGPLSEELPGRWQTYHEMRTTFAEFQELQRQGVATPFWNAKGYSFWADFHATK